MYYKKNNYTKKKKEKHLPTTPYKTCHSPLVNMTLSMRKVAVYIA